MRFLNLFAEYRDAVTARLVAEDAARRERNHADRMEARNEELSRELIDTHKILNDKLGQRFLNTRFWSEAQVGETPEHAGVPGRLQGRQAVAMGTAQARKDFDAYMKANHLDGSDA